MEERILCATAVLMPATANPYLADPTNISGPLYASDGTTPPSVSVTPNSLLTITASGEMTNNQGVRPSQPSDGDGLVSSYYGARGQISSWNLPIDSVAGIFLGSTTGTAPAPYSGSTTAYTLAPKLGQVFPIGDGYTGDDEGSLQVFDVPQGATRLYFVDIDGFQWGNNGGQTAITVNPLLTSTNVQQLATVMMSEASIGNTQEQTAVGWTVRNRLVRDGDTDVSDVWSAYSHNQTPTQQLVALATSILAGTTPDPTNGATHYYSPRSFRVDQLVLVRTAQANGTVVYNVYQRVGQRLVHQDVLKNSAGVPVTEQTTGLPVQNYIPAWVPTMTPEQVVGVRPAYFKFYRAPGNGPVN